MVLPLIPIIVLVALVFVVVIMGAVLLPVLSFFLSIAKLFNPFTISVLIALGILIFLQKSKYLKLKDTHFTISIVGLLAAFLLFGGVTSFLSIPSLYLGTQYNDANYQWSGITWTYPATYTADFGAGGVQAEGLKPSTLPDGSLKIVKQNYLQEYVEYFKSEDISSFSQIILTIKKDMKAAMQANGETRAHYRLLFDERAIDNLAVWGHCDGGGCVPANEIKTDTKNFLFKRDNSGWKVYTYDAAQTLIAESQKQNPQILFNLFGNLRGDGFSTTELIITGQFTRKNPVVTPTPPSIPSFNSLLLKLEEWFKNIIDGIPFLTVTGAGSPAPGSTQTYSVSLQAPTPLDSDYSDGTYAVRYCNVALVRSDQTVIKEKGFVACTDTFTDSFSVQIPSVPGKYAVMALMVESKGTFDFNTNTWAFTSYEPVAKEAFNVETKGVIDPTPPTPPNFISAFFGKIWDFIIGIFR